MTRVRPALAVRNMVATLILRALDDSAATTLLAAAHGALDDDAAPVPSAAAAELLATGVFAAGTQIGASTALRLRSEFAGERAAAQARLRRAHAAVTGHHERVGREGDPRSPVATALAQAAALWEARLFFEVHEVLERTWREVDGDLRRFLQGVIQIAAALHHLETGNRGGARTLLSAGRDKIAPFAPRYRDVDVGALLHGVDATTAALAAGMPCSDDLEVPVLIHRPR